MAIFTPARPVLFTSANGGHHQKLLHWSASFYAYDEENDEVKPETGARDRILFPMVSCVDWWQDAE